MRIYTPWQRMEAHKEVVQPITLLHLRRIALDIRLVLDVNAVEGIGTREAELEAREAELEGAIKLVNRGIRKLNKQKERKGYGEEEREYRAWE